MNGMMKEQLKSFATMFGVTPLQFEAAGRRFATRIKEIPKSGRGDIFVQTMVLIDTIADDLPHPITEYWGMLDPSNVSGHVKKVVVGFRTAANATKDLLPNIAKLYARYKSETEFN